MKQTLRNYSLPLILAALILAGVVSAQFQPPASAISFPGGGTNASGATGSAPLFNVTSPPSTGWSWDNQGTATVDSTNGYEYLDSVAIASAVNIVVRYRPAPATPYNISALLLPDSSITGNLTAGWGICFRDGSGKLVTYRWSNNANTASSTDFDKWTTSAAFVASYAGTTYTQGGPVNRGTATWLRIRDDGVNLSAFRSIDGLHWLQYDISRSRTDFMAAGPTQVGYFVYNNSGRAIVALLSWVVS